MKKQSFKKSSQIIVELTEGEYAIVTKSDFKKKMLDPVNVQGSFFKREDGAFIMKLETNGPCDLEALVTDIGGMIEKELSDKVPTVENNHQVKEMKDALTNIISTLADNGVPVFAMILEGTEEGSVCGNIPPQVVSEILKKIGI